MSLQDDVVTQLRAVACDLVAEGLSRQSACVDAAALEITSLRSELARKEEALKLFDDAIEEAEAILGGEYSLHYGPFFEFVDAARAALKPSPSEVQS